MRKIAKTLLTLALMAASVFAARAQDTEAFRYALEVPDTLHGAVVRISEHGSAAYVVNSQPESPSTTVSGYRVRIFFGNKQTARQDAMKVQDEFRAEFPTIPTYLVYENPAFIVTVGNCLTMEEALILQNRLKNKFSTAFLWRGQIPLAEFLREGDALPVDPNAEEAQPQDATDKTNAG